MTDNSLVDRVPICLHVVLQRSINHPRDMSKWIAVKG